MLIDLISSYCTKECDPLDDFPEELAAKGFCMAVEVLECWLTPLVKLLLKPWLIMVLLGS